MGWLYLNVPLYHGFAPAPSFKENGQVPFKGSALIGVSCKGFSLAVSLQTAALHVVCSAWSPRATKALRAKIFIKCLHSRVPSSRSNVSFKGQELYMAQKKKLG
ncbi:hypothetical protein AMTRI_Chr05g62570 [Amborella trichopoda]